MSKYVTLGQDAAAAAAAPKNDGDESEEEDPRRMDLEMISEELALDFAFPNPNNALQTILIGPRTPEVNGAPVSAIPVVRHMAQNVAFRNNVAATHIFTHSSDVRTEAGISHLWYALNVKRHSINIDAAAAHVVRLLQDYPHAPLAAERALALLFQCHAGHIVRLRNVGPTGCQVEVFALNFCDPVPGLVPRSLNDAGAAGAAAAAAAPAAPATFEEAMAAAVGIPEHNKFFNRSFWNGRHNPEEVFLRALQFGIVLPNNDCYALATCLMYILKHIVRLAPPDAGAAVPREVKWLADAFEWFVRGGKWDSAPKTENATAPIILINTILAPLGYQLSLEDGKAYVHRKAMEPAAVPTVPPAGAYVPAEIDYTTYNYVRKPNGKHAVTEFISAFQANRLWAPEAWGPLPGSAGITHKELREEHQRLQDEWEREHGAPAGAAAAAAAAAAEE